MDLEVCASFCPAVRNLAIRDIRHNFGRLVLTTIGIGLLMMIVMGLGSIERWLIHRRRC